MAVPNLEYRIILRSFMRCSLSRTDEETCSSCFVMEEASRFKRRIAWEYGTWRNDSPTRYLYGSDVLVNEESKDGKGRDAQDGLILVSEFEFHREVIKGLFLLLRATAYCQIR